MRTGPGVEGGVQGQSRTGTWVTEGWTPQPRVSELQGGGTSIPSDWGLQEDQVQQRGKARRENPEGRDRETEMEGEWGGAVRWI